MRAPRLVIILVLGVLAASLTTDSPPAGKVYRIGLLGPSSPPTDPGAARLWEALLQGLRELGYVEGQNVRFERRFSEGKDERLPDVRPCISTKMGTLPPRRVHAWGASPKAKLIG